jgi:acyl-coenzyme A synthetase/AMP-(fatty) acid ligase/acyl carrier protein
VVYLPEAATVTDFIEVVSKHQCTVVCGYVGFLRLLAKHPDAKQALAQVKSFDTFGDGMDWKDIDALRAVLPENTILIHGYGLAEICFLASHYVEPISGAGKLPMGKPHKGIELWFVGEPETDAEGALIGELAVTMPPSQNGYWRTNQNADRFVPHPTRPGLSVFLIGDIIKLQPDGVVRFRGRIDDQIKLRGHRIELEEIEVVARQAQNVDVAGVVPWRNEHGDVERLILHVAPHDIEVIDGDAVMHHIEAALPSHMHPSAIVISPSLPATTTDKIDRVRLAEFDRQVRDHEIAKATSDETHDDAWPDALSRRIAAAIAQELELETVPPDMTFDDMDGDSLTALAAALHIEKVFGVTIDPMDLLDDILLGDLVAEIADQAEALGA